MCMCTHDFVEVEIMNVPFFHAQIKSDSKAKEWNSYGDQANAEKRQISHIFFGSFILKKTEKVRDIIQSYRN